MDKKLTLSIDQRVIEKAKNYAKKHQTSLSRMVEAYFDSLTATDQGQLNITITPLVESLCGVVELPDNFDYKETSIAKVKSKKQLIVKDKKCYYFS